MILALLLIAAGALLLWMTFTGRWANLAASPALDGRIPPTGAIPV